MSLAQIRRAARSFATSMKKFMPIAQKKERRGAKRSMSSPAFCPARTYSTPSAISDQARCAELRDLHEEIHADRPEEGEARGKTIDVEPGLLSGAHVFDAVGDLRSGALRGASRPP